ncbi:hypothetical protein TorRG33x02_226900 [Trema orientale]|uniref:Uncharacterized protein n=1 Tax=Trema orientale TaxID=63057 RepID=A0A2P5E7H2_TREOI|nr:hypothetical protein TorRG33x02_226900 [Trema orientale]
MAVTVASLKQSFKRFTFHPPDRDVGSITVRPSLGMIPTYAIGLKPRREGIQGSSHELSNGFQPPLNKLPI